MRKPLLPIPVLSEADIRRFWKSVDVRGPDECWPWKAGRRKGYGRIRFGKKVFNAHRIAYFLHYGVDPGELLSCHSCDNRPCCNGVHLFGGTDQDNTVDMYAKGRCPRATGDDHWARKYPQRLARGEHHGKAKLTAEKAAEIRQRYAAGGVSHRTLAEEFCIARSTVNQILTNRTWLQEAR